jgi:hypothetical protein
MRLEESRLLKTERVEVQSHTRQKVFWLAYICPESVERRTIVPSFIWYLKLYDVIGIWVGVRSEGDLRVELTVSGHEWEDVFFN